jgi:hypothetical protein
VGRSVAPIGRLVLVGWPWLVLALALAPRLWGIGWQLPSALHFDELKYVQWAGAVAAGEDVQTDFRNPSLYRYLLVAEYRVAGLLGITDDDRSTAILQFHLARVTSAVFGAVACVLTALAAARLAACSRRPWDGPLVGGVAGLVLGWSLLHVHLSHYAVNDAVASAFLAGGLLFGVRALVAPTARDFLLAGLCAGLAAAAKYNYGVVAALPLVAAIRPCPSTASGGGGSRLWQAFDLVPSGRRIGLILLGILVGVVVGMPELVTAPAAVLAGVAEQARIGGARWNGQSTLPVWLLYLQALERGFGVAGLALALAGVLALSRRRPWALAAILTAPLLYAVVMLRNELFFARFAVPALPFLAVLAGLGVGWIVHRPLRPLVRDALVAAALGLAVVPQVLAVVRHNLIATEPDTRLLAHTWLNAEARGAWAAAETYGVPLNWEGKAPNRYRLQRYGSLADGPTIKKLACDKVRYAVLASITYERKQAWRGGQAEGYADLLRVGRPVATFDPFRPGAWAPAHIDDVGLPFWNLDAYERSGPRIEIYELSEEAARSHCAGDERRATEGAATEGAATEGAGGGRR